MRITPQPLIPRISPVERSKKGKDDFNEQADAERATKNHRDKIKRKEADNSKPRKKDQNLLGKA